MGWFSNGMSRQTAARNSQYGNGNFQRRRPHDGIVGGRYYIVARHEHFKTYFVVDLDESQKKWRHFRHSLDHPAIRDCSFTNKQKTEWHKCELNGKTGLEDIKADDDGRCGYVARA